MKILVTGGGTGGHVLPIRAVASHLKEITPKAEIEYVGQIGDRFSKLLEGDDNISQTHQIYAGKWRRYHGIPWYKQLLDIPTQILNIRDAFYVLIGIIQALMIIYRFKPDAVFIKGGYVGVPVGLAAALLRKTIITHDSDTVPGLANRTVGKWVKMHAVGAPEKYYDYPKDQMKYVGVPAAPEYKKVSDKEQRSFKSSLQLDPDEPLVLITGGSLGAQVINEAAVDIADKLSEVANVIHITGDDHIKSVTDEVMKMFDGREKYDYQVLPFVSEGFYRYSGAADVIVTRSGSVVMEFALQQKPLILVPNPRLTGGHQTANAKMYADVNAAVVIEEKKLEQNPDALLEAISKILGSKSETERLKEAISAFGRPHAARDLAELITKCIREG